MGDGGKRVMQQGDTVPDIALTLPDGSRAPLRSFVGRPLVLYFYPKDDTSGCTREAQDFSAALPEFAAVGAAVLGVSKDPPAAHLKFIEKFGLAVPLATDEGDAAMAAFGVWVEKSMYGRKYMGIDRATFLFAADGRLARAWRKVKVPGHVAEVLDAVKRLG